MDFIDCIFFNILIIKGCSHIQIVHIISLFNYSFQLIKMVMLNQQNLIQLNIIHLLNHILLIMIIYFITNDIIKYQIMYVNLHL